MDSTVIRQRVDGLTRRWVPATIVALAALLWLSSVDWKMPPDFGDTGTGCSQLCRFVQIGVDDPVVPGTDTLLEELVRPNLEVFGWVVLAGEALVAALLLSRRYLRTAAVLGVVQSVAIGLTVANGPDEWYWSYLLMIGLHLAVLTYAPELRPLPARTMAVVTAAYGVAVAILHAGAGLTGDDNADWVVGDGGRDLPDEFVRGTFPGSIALGVLLVAAAGAAWWLADTLSAQTRRTVGWVTVGVAALLLLSYRSDGLALGMGSRASTAVVLAALGLSLTGRSATAA